MNLNDSGPGSLRQAILDTPAGGTVDFQPGLTGTITLTSGELLIDKDLAIAGPGAEVLTVSGNNAARVFEIAATFTVDISGLTIANGRGSAANGGGIVNAGTLIVADSALTGNTATFGGPNTGVGGGGYNAGTLTVTNSTLSGNSAMGMGFTGRGSGGGIYSTGVLAITSCTLSGNVARGTGSGLSGNGEGTGGGIYATGVLAITNSTLSGNFASGSGGGGGIGSGGGIHADGTLTITNSSLSGNSAGGGGFVGGGIGGGIVAAGVLAITNCTLSGNSAMGGRAGGSGGGIYNEATGTVTVANSTLSGNLASGTDSGAGSGGGIANVGALTVTNSTLSGNSTTGSSLSSGGGVGNSGAAMATLRNSILAGNTASVAPDLSGGVTSQGHNLIGDGTGGSGYGDTDLVGTAENPIDPLLGPLQDNGGPTATMALLPGSPALDAGDPDQLGSPDQRGVVRTGGVNIGAYQASATAFLLTAPRRVHAGVPFDVTVTAVDPFGQVAVGYTGTVTFSTSDPRRRVVLPADYTFTLDDGGVHPFTDTGRRETTLRTHGRQTLAVADTADPSLTGQASIRVRRPRPAPGPAPGPGSLGTAPVPGNVVWLPARLIHHGAGDIEPLGWDRLDGADPVLV
jgi:hypothetical protein